MTVDPAAVPQFECSLCGALYVSASAARACADLDNASTD